MRKATLLTTTLVAAGMMAGAAHAATIQLCGPTICYEFDDTQPAIDVLGMPTLIGDGLRFLPTMFFAASSDGNGTSIANANLVIDRVFTPGGETIVDLRVRESGDWDIVNGGTVSAGLFVQLASNVDLFDTHVDIQSLNASGPSGGIQEWQLSTSINPSSVLQGPANDFSLVIQDFLTASTTASGELAWIQKKLLVELAVIPVPAAVWLFASALGLLGWMRRRAAA